MAKLAANLTMLYGEHPLAERFACAKSAGFEGVEILFPYDVPAEEIAAALDRQGLVQVLINLPPGNWDAGERGLACLPGRRGEFQDNVGIAIDYAKILGKPKLHCMAGIPPTGCDPQTAQRQFIENLQFATQACAAENITVTIEPLNTFDVPGYFLNGSQQALQVIGQVGAENLFLQYDIYHMHRMGDDLCDFVNRHIGSIGHFQIAGHPGRHEPDNGEVPYRQVLAAIEKSAYDGWIGCEYSPASTTEAGLTWARPWLDA